jgi:hypothetical protein
MAEKMWQQPSICSKLVASRWDSRDRARSEVPPLLRELRIQSVGRPFRVFYAFDPARQAVVLIGGDKTGDARFYERMVPLAERLWKEYLDETA